MKTVELKTKSKNELEKMIEDLRKKLSDLRFRFSSNQLKNVKEMSNMKKEIARIFTIIKETNK